MKKTSKIYICSINVMEKLTVFKQAWEKVKEIHLSPDFQLKPAFKEACLWLQSKCHNYRYIKQNKEILLVSSQEPAPQSHNII